MAQEFQRLIVEDSDDDEIFMLCRLSKTENGLIARRRLDITSLSESQCVQNFRFKAEGLLKLHELLRFPATLVADNSSRMNSFDAMCIMLRRLAYPSRLYDLEEFFGVETSIISRHFNLALGHVYSSFEFLLTNLNQPWLRRCELQKMADSVVKKGCPFDTCVGFIDGTNIGICRPSSYSIQRICYSGYTRRHDLKYSAVMSPNGLFMNLHGPFPGSRNDAGMLIAIKLEKAMAENTEFSTPGGLNYIFYGDQAYKPTRHIMAPFKGAISDLEKECNLVMSRIRICVEWGFGKISKLFAFTEFAQNQKLFLQPVGKYFLCAVILTNCHSCMYGSLTSTYFALEPPTLENYLTLA